MTARVLVHHAVEEGHVVLRRLEVSNYRKVRERLVHDNDDIRGLAEIKVRLLRRAFTVSGGNRLLLFRLRLARRRLRIRRQRFQIRALKRCIVFFLNALILVRIIDLIILSLCLSDLSLDLFHLRHRVSIRLVDVDQVQIRQVGNQKSVFPVTHVRRKQGCIHPPECLYILVLDGIRQQNQGQDGCRQERKADSFQADPTLHLPGSKHHKCKAERGKQHMPVDDIVIV